jgi:hypothetical protein
MGKVERRRGPRFSEKTETYSFKITPTTKRLLKEAADKHGRTPSSECEFQLKRALVIMGDRPTQAVMAAIAHSIDSLVRLRDLKPGGELKPDFLFELGEPYGRPDPKAHWLNDPYLFDRARDVVTSAFEMLRPPGDSPSGIGPQLQAGGPRQGKFATEALWRDLQLIDDSKPAGKRTPYEQWLLTVRGDLGDLVERPVIWGRTARQARRGQPPPKLYRELVELSRLAWKEFVELSRLEHHEPEAMTAAHKKRLAALRISYHMKGEKLDDTYLKPPPNKSFAMMSEEKWERLKYLRLQLAAQQPKTEVRRKARR